MRALLLFVVGCGGAGATVAVQQAEVASYEAQQIQCVTLAANRGQADQCRMAVKDSWCGDGGALKEAGACQ